MDEVTIEGIEIACGELECQLINLMDNRGEDDYLSAKSTLEQIRQMIEQLMEDEYE